MGCLPSKTPKELIIEEKEKNLMIHKNSIVEIKDAFFVLNFKDDISLENLIKGFQILKIEFTDAQKTSILMPFLKGFTKQTILVADETEYNFRDLMAVFFLMSNSNKQKKAAGLFRIFDQGNDGNLGKKEINFIIKRLLNSVNEYSQELLKKQDDLRNQIKEMEKRTKFEVKLSDIINKCSDFLLNEEKMDDQEFYNRLIKVEEKLGYDFLSTKGIRKILEESEAK